MLIGGLLCAPRGQWHHVSVLDQRRIVGGALFSVCPTIANVTCTKCTPIFGCTLIAGGTCTPSSGTDGCTNAGAFTQCVFSCIHMCGNSTVYCGGSAARACTPTFTGGVISGCTPNPLSCIAIPGNPAACTGC